MAGTMISATSLGLDYTIYSQSAQSLRRAVVKTAIGGKLYGDNDDSVRVRALDNVTFDLQEGDRLGLLGHNGSGKSSLLKVLAGIYEPSAGRLDIRGRVSSMIDIGHGINGDVDAIENIRLLGAMRLLKPRYVNAYIDDILEFADLGSYAHLPVKTYSSGMVMRLLFAAATAFDPDILLLDEWLGAGDANFVDKASKRMNNIVDAARIVVFASHAEEVVRSICNKIMVLRHGRVIHFGPADHFFATRS